MFFTAKSVKKHQIVSKSTVKYQKNFQPLFFVVTLHRQTRNHIKNIHNGNTRITTKTNI
jgi:hypothetical protein